MARTTVASARIVRERFYWPDVQLNIWTIVMLATAGTILGVFANFMNIQHIMRQPTPWLFTYGVVVGSLTIVLIIIELILIAQRRLMPGVMLLFSFILLVLYITGIIATAIQLFGGPNINNQCQRFVNDMKITGPSASTLAWLEQQSICQSWQAVFAFWIIGSVFLIWMMVMANQVRFNQYDYRD